MSAFPATRSFQHLSYNPEMGVDAHGNIVGSYGDPVERLAIGWYQTGSTEPISVDTVARTITELTIMVDDPTVFTARDMVMVSGQAFEVAGVPADWAGGFPWGQYADVFGGEIRCRRVD